MPTTAITSPVTITVVLPTLSAGVVGRSDFHAQIYVNDFREAFLNTDEFAEYVTYMHASLGVSVNYAALFDDPHTSMDIGDGIGVNNLRPQVILSESDLRHVPVRGDTCIARGLVYYVDDYHKDGVGSVIVYLRQR